MKRTLVVLIVSFLFAACSSATVEPTVTETVEPTVTETTASPTEIACSTSPLTGECYEPDNPVLLVKIDDVKAARPQLNLNIADVVIVEPVEYGLTRLMAVYNSDLPETVGPVRSARITDIDLAAAFGRPGFAYSGSTSKLVPYLTSSTMQLIGEPQGGTGYSRDGSRYAPHNLVANTSELISRISDLKAAKLETGSLWKFGELTAQGKVPLTVEAIWNYSRKSFVWSPSAKKWLISADGSDTNSLSSSGLLERASATTIFIQQTELLPSPFVFSNGAVTPYAKTTGSGAGWVLTQGQSFYGRWSRPTTADLPQWFDKNGVEIAIQPGNVWWIIVDRANATVKVKLPKPSNSGAKSTSKAD
jgi:hypothetical protein